MCVHAAALVIREDALRCRDAIMPQHSYEVAATSLQYAICDNLLLVFNEAGAVYVMDVDATDNAAVSGPQPFHIARLGVCITLTCL